MGRTRRLRAIYGLFLVSGAAGLIYEVVWARLLKEVFGVTAYAVATVLAAYLGGLALGAWLLGSRVDRQTHPLRFYGFLELGIAATAFLGALLLRFLEPLHDAAAIRLSPGSPMLLLIRVLLASLVVLPPTFLMGGTLPAVTRAVVADLRNVGRDLSLLYALNTGGAVAGTLVAGFVLIRALGVHPTLWLAAAANVLVGAAALALAARAEPDVPASEGRAPSGHGENAGLLVAVALSGVVTLALEVIWTRLLILIVGSSTHAFVTMLAAFLVGIALGSAIMRRVIARIREPRRAFGWVQAGIAGSTLATIPLMNALVIQTQQWMFALEARWVALSLARFGIAFLIMLVPTILIGMVFPLAGSLRVRGVRSAGGDLGELYGALTLGNIAGAILAAFVLLPLAGMQRGIVLTSTASVLAAAWAFFPSRGKQLVGLRTAPALAASLLWAGLLVSWHPRPFVSIEEGPADPVRFYEEGLVSTVKVIQRAADARQVVMLVDGVRIGQSSAGIDNKQQVLAHLPFLLRPGRPPTRVLTIGLGTGIVTGEVTRHPGVEEIDSVELSSSVIEGAKQFAPYNGDVLHNPKVRVIEDDGINFLKRTPRRYDAIISDGKSRLGQAGNALFYARDYYQSARRHLLPAGLMIQWMPLEEVAEDLRTIVRTFMGVFPCAYLFVAHDSYFLVGMEEPLALEVAELQRELDAPAVADLRRYGWRDAEEISSLLVADNESANGWLAKEDTVNSLEHPVLEFYSPRALALPAATRRAENAAAVLATRETALRSVRLRGGDLRSLQNSGRALEYVLSALVLIGRDYPASSGDARALLEKAAAHAIPGGVIRSWVAASLVGLGADMEERGALEQAFALYRSAVDAWPESLNAHLELGRLWAMQGQFREAAGEFRKALDLNRDSGAAHRSLGKIFRDVADLNQAIASYREALRIAPDDAETHVDLGQSLALAGRPDDALREFAEAMRLKPRWPIPMASAAMLLATHPDAASRNSSEAIKLARRAADLTSGKDSAVLEILAASYAAAGRFDEAVTAERKALDISAKADPKLAAEMEAALELYRRGLTRR
ncbi:MAG: tetratricopeptide repeat protein [Deltaproteobacteria bacterium]|nr:MAG: tetratricopeptide repeat protein [Deltaproteobacteria bacterium]